MTPEILSAIRAVLAAGGGYVIGKGWVTAAGWDTVLGAVMVLVPVVWGIWAKQPSSPEAKAVAEKVGAAS